MHYISVSIKLIYFNDKLKMNAVRDRHESLKAFNHAHSSKLLSILEYSIVLKIQQAFIFFE